MSKGHENKYTGEEHGGFRFARDDKHKRDLEDSIGQEGVKACDEQFRKKMQEWKSVPLKVAVIGGSGAGKSSFINAIRGLEGDDEGAAPVGVTEQTIECSSYTHPNNENFKFVDVPGVGTKNFPKEEYLEKIGFHSFDFFILVTSVRFTELDLWLVEEIIKEKKAFFFTRTKIGIDLENDRKTRPKTYKSVASANTAKQEIMDRILKDVAKNLGKHYHEDRVFLIDSYQKEMYDFNKMEKQLIDDFPELKREALIFSMSAHSREIIEAKVKALRAGIWKAALLSGSIAAIPIPGISFAVDMAIVTGYSRYYWCQLGLDDASLELLAKRMEVDVAELKDQILSRNSGAFLTIQGIKELLLSIPAMAISEAVEEGARFIPIVGSIISATTSAVATRYLLGHILDEHEKTALAVVDTALEASKRASTEGDFENRSSE